MKEIWGTIKDNKYYQVSNLGRVKSLERYDRFNRHISEKILVPRVHSSGYLRVQINRKDYYIHRLVAETFIDNPNNYKEISHEDNDKTNNCISNLKWCTRQYNNKKIFTDGIRTTEEMIKISHMRKCYREQIKSNLQEC